MTRTGAADVIFTGRIRTQSLGSSRPTAVAVANGTITAVGGDEVLELRGSETEIIDVRHGLLIPGFVDAHIHAVLGGVARAACDLSDVHSLEQYRDIINDYARSHDGPWIEGAGWYGDLFPNGYPTKEFLDELIPDRPAAFASHDVHSLWVNSKALDMAGIGRHTPDPVGGRITRTTEGDPAGLLMEHAMELLAGVRPVMDDAKMRAGLMRAQDYLHSLGVTSWQDALVGAVFGYPDIYDTYLNADLDGLLLSRVTGAQLWDGQTEATSFIDRRGRAHGHFRATAAKIILDGNCENLTAAVHEAYAGHPHEHGILQFDAEQLCDGVAMLSDAGLDVHIHAVGDLAVTRALDAFTPVVTHPDHRHQIAHIDLVLAGDIQRMADLGVTANVSPLWARLDPVLVETKLPLLTSTQQDWHFAYGSLHQAGIPVAFGSDWPVSTPDPIAGLHTAVNRTAAPDDPHAADTRSRHEPLLARERLSLETSLDAYTRVAARASRLDSFVGIIEVGKEADLVILDRDPFDIEPEAIGETKVARTFVRGTTVFCR